MDATKSFWMKPFNSKGFMAACLLAVAPGVYAQSSRSSDSSSQNKPAASSQNSQPAQQPSRSQQQSDQNPFPEDTNSVPVMPSRDSSGSLPAADNEAPQIPIPAEDADPVRTPEEAGAAAEAGEQKYSSSLSGMSDLIPPANDDTTQSGKRHRKGADSDIVPEHHESAKEDESVGSYYLSNKDWKGALSRFESALVLDPENPDVYWGLAECQRNLGDYIDARKNYLKVMEYDPGSHHAKDARKHLEEPELANAKPQADRQSVAPHP